MGVDCNSPAVRGTTTRMPRSRRIARPATFLRRFESSANSTRQRTYPIRQPCFPHSSSRGNIRGRQSFVLRLEYKLWWAFSIYNIIYNWLLMRCAVKFLDFLDFLAERKRVFRIIILYGRLVNREMNYKYFQFWFFYKIAQVFLFFLNLKGVMLILEKIFFIWAKIHFTRGIFLSVKSLKCSVLITVKHTFFFVYYHMLRSSYVSRIHCAAEKRQQR